MKLFFLILFFIVNEYCQANIAVTILKFIEPYDARTGLATPDVLKIVEGHDALLKLKKPLTNQVSCTLTTNIGISFDVNAPPSNRYEAWSENCGVRIKNVTHQDEGRWKLTASRPDTSILGFSEIHVNETFLTNFEPTMNLLDGTQHTIVNMTNFNSSYCVVTQPFADSNLVPGPGQCSVTLDKVTRAVQGLWNVVLGVPGKIQEVHLAKQVAVEAERLDVGYIIDKDHNKIHLHCNLLNSARNVSFCRFQRTSQSYGYNLVEGLSDGHYSYYGDGLFLQDCGMTIEHPTVNDYGTWRCSVGIYELVIDVEVPKTPMQALITVPQVNLGKSVSKRESKTVTEITTIFTQRDYETSITCHADAALSYCWFQDPYGNQYTPLDKVDEEPMDYWYTGNSLLLGDCGITFANATEEFAGIWTCHMGPSGTLGIELTDQVEIRITGALAAYNLEVQTSIGSEATLYCHTSNGNRALDYCRFLSPNNVGINVDSTITQETAILGRYYFTANRTLDYGDCSLTIYPVTGEDLGLWTCAARVHEEIQEGRDTIELMIGNGIGNGGQGVSQAGIAGVVIGIAVLVVVLAGTVWYKRFGTKLPWRNSTNTVSTTQRNFIDMDSRSQSSNESGNNN